VPQIDRRHLHQRRLGLGRRPPQARLHRQYAQRLFLLQQFLEHGRHLVLALPARQVQQPDVLGVGTPGLLLHQGIIGAPIGHARIEIFPVHVAGEGPGLAHQPVDHVPVVDAMLVLAAQPLHTLHQLPGVADLDQVHADARLDHFAPQPRRHRVGVVLDADGAAPADAHPLALERLQAPRRQRPHLSHLLGHLGGPRQVPCRGQAAQPLFILLTAGEVAAAAQQQGLLHRRLEMPMRRLRIAVLMRAGRIGRFRLLTVMRHQRPILVGELLGLTVVMHRQAHAIGAMTLGHGAQGPQRILITGAQADKTLRGTHGHVLPIGIRQHPVVHQVGEGHALDGHVQVVHGREVRGRQASGWMLLGEEQFLGRAMQGLPLAHAPFQRPPQRRRILARIGLLQPVPQGLGLQAWLVVQPGRQLEPDLGQGIGPSSPGVWLAGLARHLTELAILAGRLAIHVCLQRCYAQRCSLIQLPV
jgi:hypothetical protein